MAKGRRGPNKKPGPKSRSKWREEYLTFLPELIRKGTTITQVAKIIKVNIDTLYDWQNKDKRFSEVMIQARDDYNCGRVENSLLRRAKGYKYVETTKEVNGLGEVKLERKVKKTVPPDTQAITFFLKNRAPDRWKDKHEIEGGLTILSPVPIEKPDTAGL